VCASVLSIQTAGLAFGSTGLCSYRVRVVGGSRAEHLTVESYTIIISLQSYLLSYLLLLVFHHHRRRLSLLGTGAKFSWTHRRRKGSVVGGTLASAEH